MKYLRENFEVAALWTVVLTIFGIASTLTIASVAAQEARRAVRHKVRPKCTKLSCELPKPVLKLSCDPALAAILPQCSKK